MIKVIKYNINNRVLQSADESNWLDIARWSYRRRLAFIDSGSTRDRRETTWDEAQYNSGNWILRLRDAWVSEVFLLRKREARSLRRAPRATRLASALTQLTVTQAILCVAPRRVAPASRGVTGMRGRATSFFSPLIFFSISPFAALYSS